MWLGIRALNLFDGRSFHRLAYGLLLLAGLEPRPSIPGRRVITAARALALIALFAPAAAAEEAPPAPEAGEETGTLDFTLENDLFYGRDQDYTNGIQFSWTTAPGATPGWALRAARLLPFFPKEGKVRTSYAVGQAMYTPGDITLTDPPADDRPYAGWLYGSIGLVSETETTLDQLQLQLGVVGPASLAEQSQKLVHQIIGSPEPQGWDTQLENEPGVVLTYQRSWRAFASGELGGMAFDATPHIGGALGNVYTYANAGATLRLGWNLPNDYGPPRIQPSLPGSGFVEPRDGVGGYLFAGVDGRVVARNIFLDGNTFGDSRSVDKIPLVADLQVGFAITWRDVRLAYTHVFRTKEFETQRDADNFGAISLTVRF